MNSPQLSQLVTGRGRTFTWKFWIHSTKMLHFFSWKTVTDHLPCSNLLLMPIAAFSICMGVFYEERRPDNLQSLATGFSSVPKRKALLSWCLQGEAVTPGNASLMDTLNLEGKLPKQKKVQIIESYCPYLDNNLSQVFAAMWAKGIDFIVRCHSQLFGSELICAFFRDTKSQGKQMFSFKLYFRFRLLESSFN